MVASFWVGQWDLRGHAPHTTLLLSDPCIHFVFESGQQHNECRLVGVWTRLWERTLESEGRVFGVKCRAGAARAFLEHPAATYTNRRVPLVDSFGAEAETIRLDVAACPTDDAAFRLLTDWLIRHQQASDQTSFVIALVERIAQDSEITSVEQLSAVAGVGARSLQRLFREHVGASPKWVIQRNRLQEAALQIELAHRGDLTRPALDERRRESFAAIAAKLGYTDQAHFARDFRHAVGKSPSEFAHSLSATD